jgi:sporulation protein YlmC with PRC-barrel domain
MEAINTMEDYLKSLEGKRVGVSIGSRSGDILGSLLSVTVDENSHEVTGIIVEKWGWINKSDIKRINEVVPKKQE